MSRPDPKWIRTRSDEAAVDEGCWWDQSAADRVRAFVERFCIQSIGKWAGKPLQLLPWQWVDLVAPLYAFRRPDGTRRFREVSVWVGKNNGKSTLASAISAYELIASGEQGAQVVNLASTIEQANIVFRQTRHFFEQSPALLKHVWIRDNIKTIEFGKTRSTLKVMSGEAKGKRGYSISALLFDELSEILDRTLYDSMKLNTRKRENGFLLSISTAGYRRESIAFEQFTYAQKVLRGEIVDTAFLPVVYAADAADDWTSEETFKKANPSYGVTIDPAEVRDSVQEAKNEPRKESAWKTERLNVWCGSSSAWISSAAWEACKMTSLSEDDFHGLDAWVGIDYGYKHDLAAYTIVCERDGIVYLFPRAFCPRKNAEAKQLRDRVPYLQWASDPKNNFHLTAGDVIDPAFIREQLARDAERFRFAEVGYDPTGLEETRQILEREHGWAMVAVPQRARYLGGAAGFLERSVIGRTVRHPGNPVLNWCLENCASKETPDGIFVYKGGTDGQRIDVAVSALIGLSRYLARSTAPSDYVLFL